MGSLVSKHVFITHSGLQFRVDEVKPEYIVLDDIAHHLTKECRFGGAMELEEHYSVAQHSIILSDYALEHYGSISLSRNMLFHDAAEYILKDLPSGVKAQLPEYKELENKIDGIIRGKYGIAQLGPEMGLLAKELDTKILLDEARHYTPRHLQVFLDQHSDIEGLGIKIRKLSKAKVKAMFLDRCERFGIGD